MAGTSSAKTRGACHRAADPLALWPGHDRQNGSLLAVGALAGRGLARRERIDRRGAALLEVLVGFRFLLFLVAAHLTLGHDDLPLRPVEKIRRGVAIANPLMFVCRGIARFLTSPRLRERPKPQRSEGFG